MTGPALVTPYCLHALYFSLNYHEHNAAHASFWITNFLKDKHMYTQMDWYH
jgi:hypothetical protein